MEKKDYAIWYCFRNSDPVALQHFCYFHRLNPSRFAIISPHFLIESRKILPHNRNWFPGI